MYVNIVRSKLLGLGDQNRPLFNKWKKNFKKNLKILLVSATAYNEGKKSSNYESEQF